MKSLLTTFLVLAFTTLFAQKQKVWLDADTGNEVDDVFAIVRLLWASNERDIVGLSSAHFNNADLVAFEKWNQYTTPGINTVRISQGLNEEILSTMGLSNLPHPMGADRQMGRAWGGFQPRPSAATTELLRIISALKPGEKLDILTIGATTNIASLMALDSTVKAKIRLYSLGGGYDQTRKAWNKNEFNVRCDLNAFDFLMNQTGLDWTVMTISTAAAYRVERDDFFKKLADDRPTEQLMERRWRETEASSTSRVLWDVALVQAYLRPQFAEIISVPTPPENHPHPVKIWSKIDAKGMYDEFWQTVKQHRNTYQQPTQKARLGDRHYGNRVGGTVAQEGPTIQLICLNEGDQLQSVQVGLNPAGNVVRAVQLVVQPGSGPAQTHVFGRAEGGKWQPVFAVKNGRKLVGISGAAGWFIDNIRFHFDDGSITPPYGGSGGDMDYRLVLTKDPKGQYKGRWIGFWGSATDQLESIGLVFFPVE